MAGKKWDDKKEGRKPWEAKKKPAPSVAMPPKKKKKKKKAKIGSIAEDLFGKAGELAGRNKKIVKKVGGWSKSDK